MRNPQGMTAPLSSLAVLANGGSQLIEMRAPCWVVGVDYHYSVSELYELVRGSLRTDRAEVQISQARGPH